MALHSCGPFTESATHLVARFIDQGVSQVTEFNTVRIVGLSASCPDGSWIFWRYERTQSNDVILSKSPHELTFTAGGVGMQNNPADLNLRRRHSCRPENRNSTGRLLGTRAKLWGIGVAHTIDTSCAMP